MLFTREEKEKNAVSSLHFFFCLLLLAVFAKFCLSIRHLCAKLSFFVLKSFNLSPSLLRERGNLI